MTDRPAGRRMPTPKQMEKLASEAVRRHAVPTAAPDEALPAEDWDAVLKDPRAGDGVRMRERKLSEIPRHGLRVSCRRCERIVEIQTVDAVRIRGREHDRARRRRAERDDLCPRHPRRIHHRREVACLLLKCRPTLDRL